MPEAPDLEVVREFLTERVVGLEVRSADVVEPSVLRSLAGDISSNIQGRTMAGVERKGKLLLIRLSGAVVLSINPMLTGALQYCPPCQRRLKRTCVALGLSNDMELRYLDERQMGSLYYVGEEQLDSVPRLNEQGPDVLDNFSFEEFEQNLRRFHGEIKGILTRGRVIAGIGNAYSDEILFASEVNLFRKRKAQKPEELRRIYAKSRQVVEDAIPILRERMGEAIHVKVRDFLKVHNRGCPPCPRCGNTISQVTANKRITSYCRRRQPGMLIKN